MNSSHSHPAGASLNSLVKHRRTTVGGIETFFREAGPKDAPVLLLPHGYPCSSYEFRNLMPALSDQWHVLAPDFPGCGYTATPENFAYGFDGYAEFLQRFLESQGVDRFALYLHDFGTWIGLRLAQKEPRRVAGYIIQNGDIYEDALGPKYAALKETLAKSHDAARSKIEAGITEEEFRIEFLNEVNPAVAECIPPDLWKLHWSLATPERRAIHSSVIASLKENFTRFPNYQAFLKAQQTPTLIVWGPSDGYMPAKSARAYLRDLPNAEFHLFEDGGHWLLETHLPQVAPLIRDFLMRIWK